MHPDLVAAFGVAGIVGGNLDRPAITVEKEVVGCFFVREAHRMIATCWQVLGRQER